MNQKKKVSKRQMPLPQNAPKVLVSISLAHASWRDFFSGILRYVDEHANWDIRIAHEPGDLLAGQIDEAERGHYAGIILATPGDIDFKRLNRSSIPLAYCGNWPELRQRERNIVNVNFDCAAHGATGPAMPRAATASPPSWTSLSSPGSRSYAQSR